MSPTLDPLAPVQRPVFKRLCDMCDRMGLHIGIRVLQHATDSNGGRARIGIVIYQGKNSVVNEQQVRYDQPSIDALAKRCIQELNKRGFNE